MLTRIDGTLRDYAWGMPGGVSAMLGRPVGPSGGLEAEYWLSAGGLLLKVLAAGEPLSLQVHPTAALAEAGFAREDLAGIEIGDPRRSFKDRAAKAEMILALSDRFEALVGFVTAQEAKGRFSDLVSAIGSTPPGAEEFFGLLADDSTVGDAFVWLVSGGEAARDFAALSLAALEAQPDRFPVQAEIARLRPGDVGVVASLLLNHVVLSTGEALAVPPGTIHAYLRGTGLEVMVDSDNVLRAGLTSKHVDVPRLAEALTRSASDPHRPPGMEFSGGVEHRFPATDVELRLSTIRDSARVPVSGSAIAIALDGSFEIRAGGDSIAVERGEAVHIAFDGDLEISGTGSLYLAR